MGYKKWNIRPADKEFAKEIAAECSVNQLCALLLTSRGYTEPDVIEDFIYGYSQLRDPYEMQDMDLAVERITIAIDNDEKIAVYGDYDADGITSTALLYTYLKGRTPNVVTYIPDRREEGYGMNIASIDRLAQQGVTLIITVDNGISCLQEVEYAAKLDIDVVVTDHHLPGDELPKAVAVVDPHRVDCPSEFKDYAGVGVAFKLVCALEGGACEELLPVFGPLVAVGTVADIVALKDENRILVREGVKYLNETRNVGLRALIGACGLRDKKIEATQISFQIAPRLNATGRMGSAQPALDLLITQDREEAYRISTEINDRNTQRQSVERQVFDEAVDFIETAQKQYQHVVVVWGNHWHLGVLGIVASKLMERYGKPCIVLNVEGEQAHGSARSYGEFSMHQALSTVSGLLTKFGGHKQAAGMALETDKLEDFEKEINRYAAAVCPQLIQTLEIDCNLNPRGVTLDTAKAISELAPFGMENPVPLFGLMNLTLDRVTPVGDNHHLRLTLSRDGVVITAMKFATQPQEFCYEPGDTVDLAVTLDINEYRGQESLSVIVRDIRPAGLDDSFYHSFMMYQAVERQDQMQCSAQELLPERSDLALVYRRLQAQKVRCEGYDRLFAALENKLGYTKLYYCVQIMEELGIAEIQPIDHNNFIFSLPVLAEKRSIDASQVLDTLRKRIG